MIPNIPEIDVDWRRRAEDYQSRLTMPSGALGRLLEVGQQLCAIQETLRPATEPAAVVVLAADHGVAEEEVSAYPQKVSAQMLANFRRGGAAVSVLARRQRARLIVVDMGVKDPPETPSAAADIDFVSAFRIAPGTANFVHRSAMTQQQLNAALAAGSQVVKELLVPRGVRVVALGEMGIGNTTSASALTALLAEREASQVTGRGTGLDDHGLWRKIGVIGRALQFHFPNRSVVGLPSWDDALQKLGGLEIAGLVGVALEAAAQRILVLLDGFISTIAGFLGMMAQPALRNYLMASHRSVERGHQVLLERMRLRPMFDFGMRLGEGTGAVLALPFVHSAADLMRDMATFESAGVSDRAK